MESQNPKCQDLPKFQLGGGGDLESQNPKCQDLPKFQLGGGGVIYYVCGDQQSFIWLNISALFLQSR